MLQFKTKMLAQCVLLAFAAITTGTAHADAAADARFESVANDFIQTLLRTHPETATAMGDHRYDNATSDYSLHGVAADRVLYHHTLDLLTAIPAKDLSPDDAVDSAILQNELHSRLFDIEVMNVPAREPLYY